MITPAFLSILINAIAKAIPTNAEADMAELTI